MISSKGFCFPYKKGMKCRKPCPRWRSLWTEPFRGGWGNSGGKHTGRTIESFHCLFYYVFFFKDFCGVRLGILTCLRNALIFFESMSHVICFFFKGKRRCAMRSKTFRTGLSESFCDVFVFIHWCVFVTGGWPRYHLSVLLSSSFVLLAKAAIQECS